MVQYSIPKRVGLDDIKDIIKAYYVEGAHNEPVRTSAVEDTAQLPDRVGRQTDFLEEVGILEKEGRQRVLTSAGEEIAEALMGGGEEMARSRMRELLTDWEFTSKAQGFVRLQGPVEESQLLEYITANIESDDARGKQTLLEIFLWTDILQEVEEGVYTASESKSNKPQPTPPESGEQEKSALTETEGDQEQGYSTESIAVQSEGEISVEFSFTADDDPKEITEVILAARKAFESNIKEEDDSEIEQSLD